MKQCPICLKEFINYPSHCECGFQFNYLDTSKENILFTLFKYSKSVYLGEINYPKADLIISGGEYFYIEDIDMPKSGLVYISYHHSSSKTYLSEGLLSTKLYVKSLIIDCDIIDSKALDESYLEVLVISNSVNKITNNILLSPKTLCYIYVDDKNKTFKSYDNVLINQKTKEIVCYPNGKKDKIYYVPKFVAHIDNNVFADNKFIEEIFVPIKTRVNSKIDFKDLKINRY